MENSLNILLVEDDEDDFVLTKELLVDSFGKRFELTWISTGDAALDALDKTVYDICLVDYQLGKWNGLELVREAIRRGSKSPFIMLTGQENRAIDLEASQAGATDYLVKSQITAPMLERAVRYAQERKRTEERLSQLAQYDPLTGLANRACFATRLKDGIKNSKRLGNELAVLLLDLDHFKTVNDLYGHPAGDALLVEVAKRLVECVRESDTVARLGGDEFAIIATNLGEADGSRILAHKIVKAIKDPFELEDQTIISGTSIGIAVFSPENDDPDDLLKNADLALYQAKNAGRGTVHIHSHEMNAEALSQKALEMDICRAVDCEEMELHFQPILDSKGGVLIGAEAFLRWNHPHKGILTPEDFLSVANTTGLIMRIGEQAMHMACAHSVAWRRAGLPAIPLAINISSLQLRSGKLASTVAHAISETGAEAAELELEFSEETIRQYTDTQGKEWLRLSELGVGLVVDNFGTGASCLASFKQLPFSKLKIGRSFMNGVSHGSKEYEVLSAIVALGKAFDMQVIATGIETEEQLSAVSQTNCDGVQGFHFLRPLPEAEFISWGVSFMSDGTNARPDALGDTA